MSKRYNSSRDMLQLVAEMNVRRMPMVFDRWYRSLFGMRLQGMKSIKRLTERMTRDQLMAYKTVRNLHWRYEKNEFWHTNREIHQVVEFGKFLVRTNAECQHQTPGHFEIDLRKMSCREHLPPGSYDLSRQLTEVM